MNAETLLRYNCHKSQVSTPKKVTDKTVIFVVSLISKTSTYYKTLSDPIKMKYRSHASQFQDCINLLWGICEGIKMYLGSWPHKWHVFVNLHLYPTTSGNAKEVGIYSQTHSQTSGRNLFSTLEFLKEVIPYGRDRRVAPQMVTSTCWKWSWRLWCLNMVCETNVVY
jgi:hypothetical protein